MITSKFSVLFKILFLLSLFFTIGCTSNKTTPSARIVEFDELAGVMPEIPKGGGSRKVGKPYKILGEWYIPKENKNYKSVGIASWYGTDFHGRLTANGEIYDMNAMTAAHPTLPMPSIVKVTNLENGRTAVVRVNDRGPFAKDREIDMSRAAAEHLGFKKKGTAKVKVEFIKEASLANVENLERQLLSNNQIQYAKALKRARNIEYAKNNKKSYNRNMQPKVSNVSYVRNNTSPSYVPQKTRYKVRKVVREPVSRKTAAKLAATYQARQDKAKTRRFEHAASQQKVTTKPTSIPSYYVQIGAFGNTGNVEKVVADLRNYIYKIQIEPVLSTGRTLQRVRLGPIYSKKEALESLTQLTESGWRDSRLVVASQ